MSTTYTMLMLDGSGVTRTIAAADLDAARAEARAWAQAGDYDVVSTVWTDVRITWSSLDEDGDEVINEDEVTNIAIDPPEPPCAEGAGHDWQAPHAIVGGLPENPGMWGHGAGVRLLRVCMHCGCGRHQDTWAQRPDTGAQGLDSVSYVRGEYASEIARITEDKDA